LLVFRAIAFRELKQYELSIETFKIALAKRSRESEILNFAKFERACTYEAMGKKAQAIKELQKILAANYNDKAAQDKLTELQK
jgi:tetratricopeptide (TPR) repeat protein